MRNQQSEQFAIYYRKMVQLMLSKWFNMDHIFSQFQWFQNKYINVSTECIGKKLNVYKCDVLAL